MNDKNKIRYFKLAKFLSSHGIKPPLTSSKSKITLNWKEQGTEMSHYKPENYLDINDSVYTQFRDVLPLLDKYDKILEIGCNCGRNLKYLYDNGFKNFTGIDISKLAINLFKLKHNDTYNNTNIIVGNAVEEIKKLKDQFDLIFTRGVLINIKENSIFKDMCRLSNKYILTSESEGSWTAYPRDFQKMFDKNGFEQISFNWYIWNDLSLCYPKRLDTKNYLRRHVVRLFVKRDV